MTLTHNPRKTDILLPGSVKIRLLRQKKTASSISASLWLSSNQFDYGLLLRTRKALPNPADNTLPRYCRRLAVASGHCLIAPYSLRRLKDGHSHSILPSLTASAIP